MSEMNQEILSIHKTTIAAGHEVEVINPMPSETITNYYKCMV